MKTLLWKYNTSAYQELRKIYLSKGGNENVMNSVIQSQLRAFETEAADIQRKNPELYTAAFDDLSYWIFHTKTELIRERTKLEQLYFSKLSSLVKTLMTETDIRAASDQVVLSILGENADPSYIAVFHQGVEPILKNFVKVSLASDCDFALEFVYKN